MAEYRMDRTAFKLTNVADAERAKIFDKDTPLTERLRQVYYLTLSVYGYSIDNPPRMDKTVFNHRKRGF